MKKDQLKVFIIACLVVTLCAFSYATYAFYQTSFSGTATGTLAAAWDFNFLGKDSGEYQSLKGSSQFINLGKSCTNCVDEKLQPGSYGEFSIKVDASTSSVKTKAVVTMFNLRMGGQTELPAGLEFYLVNGTNEDKLSNSALTGADGVALYDNSATPWAGDADKTAEKVVKWIWVYGTGNDNDFQGKDITFSLKAVAEQVAEEVS